jgi:hypothetical protein
MEKSYVGRREDGALKVFVVRGGKDSKPLNPRYDLRNHSPTGFECGYCGSGPAQLALAICASALEDDDLAGKVYQQYKNKVIANLSQECDWVLLEAEVLAVLRSLVKE